MPSDDFFHPDKTFKSPDRLFGLPLRRRPLPPPVDAAAVARTLAEAVQLTVDALLALAAILAGYLTLTQLVKTWVVRRFKLD